MSSTLVLIALMISLSIAVVFPELQYSKVNKSIEPVEEMYNESFEEASFEDSSSQAS